MYYEKLEQQVKNVQRASRELMEIADAELKQILLDAENNAIAGSSNASTLIDLLQDTNNIHASIVKLSLEVMKDVRSVGEATGYYGD